MNEFLNKLKFNEAGLIPVITQDSKTNKVLMQAWMNAKSIEITLDTGFVTYFSRSRQELWKKGETSGHFQELVSITTDCDFDCILIKANQTGVACHTGEESCFFNVIR